MTESIGEKLTTLCGSLVPFYLSEAETESYPYAVYEQTTQEFRTKDGVYKITADSYIRIYSKSFDEAQAKADLIRSALDNSQDGQYIIRHRTTTKECMEDVWVIELLYFVKQTS